MTFFQDLIRKYLFQELIKTVASAHQLNTEGQREFKVSILQYTTNTTVSADPIRLVLFKHGFYQVVVLTEVDRLTKDAQHALRQE